MMPVANPQVATVSPTVETPTPSPPATPGPKDRDFMAVLRAKIKERQKEPAENVFNNIQTLKGKSAGTVLAIMDIGYDQSLGVGCAYCHNTDDWASDEKSEKRTARQMSNMAHDINEKMLPAIEGLKSDKPMVNCTTCHRGDEKPALDLKQ